MKPRTQPHVIAATVLTALLTLTACAPMETAQPDSQAPAEDITGTPYVQVSYTSDWEKEPPKEYILDCGNLTASTFPMNGPSVCFWLEKELPALKTANYGEVCTQQYGGPAEATVRIYERVPGVSGLIQTTFDLSLSNGCKIAQWEEWKPLLLPLTSELPRIKGPVPVR